MPPRSTEQLVATRRTSPKWIDHGGLLRDYSGQDFLFFALRHIEVVERVRNLSTDLVELFDCYVEILVGSPSCLPVYSKGPPATGKARA
jgi:hypothetical protein